MILQFGEFLRYYISATFGITYCVVAYLASATTVLCGWGLWGLCGIRFRKTILWAWILFTLSMGIGLWRISEFPVRIHPDEQKGGDYLMESNQWPSGIMSVSDMMKGRKAPFIKCFWNIDPRHNARPRFIVPLHPHVTFLSYKVCESLQLIQPRFRVYRIGSVFMGAVFVVLLFLMLKSMFGMETGIIAGLLVVASPWHLALSRLALPYITVNLYVLICLCVFWHSLKYGWFYPLLAVLVAFSLTLYSSVKMVFYFIPIFIIYNQFHHKSVSKRLFGIAGVLLFVAILIPLLMVQGITAQLFFGYSQSGAEVTPSFTGIANTATEIFNLSWTRFLTFSRRNYIELGMRFNPIVVMLAIVGIAMCVKSITYDRSQCAFLLLWLILAMMPDAMSLERSVSRRATVVIAPMLSLAAVGLYTLLPYQKYLRRVIAGVIIAVVLVTNYLGYFEMYDNLIETNTAYQKIQAEKFNQRGQGDD